MSRTTARIIASMSFMSTAPRPQIMPSRTSAENGSTCQSAASAGTTSVCPWRTSAGCVGSVPSMRSTTDARPGSDSMSSGSQPTSVSNSQTYPAAAGSPGPDPAPEFEVSMRMRRRQISTTSSTGAGPVDAVGSGARWVMPRRYPAGRAPPVGDNVPMTTDIDTALPADNPFAAPSPLPYELPDFAAIRHEHLRPAVLAALAQQRAEWETIATDPATPDVANTLEALERSGDLWRRVAPVLNTLVSSRADDALHELEAELAPLLAAHRDAMYLDRRIFARLEALADADLDPETAWLLHTYRKDFVRAGVRLDDESQAGLRDLNARITSLETESSRQVVKGLDAGALHLTAASRLAGLSDDAVAGLAQVAADRGRDGYLITLQLPTQQALLAQLQDRDLRRQLLTASLERGTGGGGASGTPATRLQPARRPAAP